MQSKLALRVIFVGAICLSAWGQPARRFAFVEAHGPLARANQIFAIAENLLTDGLTAKLTGQPGFTLIDRASVDTIIKEQNFQNSDRSSADTAARIGKLLGVTQVGLVNLTDLSYTEHDDRKWNKISTIGTTVIRANVRVIDVETGAILVEPSSAFQESVLAKETIPPGPFNPQPKVKLVEDPEVMKKNEWAKGSEKIISELIPKLIAALERAPGPKAAAALVAGIANGSVVINQGKIAGVAKGSKFQVTREVDLGLTDPATGKPMKTKQQICVLTIVNADETNASGTCQGGLPQSKDIAEPLQP